MQDLGGRKVYSVAEINYFAKQTLEQIEVWVIGEITTFKKNPSWRFYYLDLKDDSAILPCVASGDIFSNFQGDLIGQKILAYGFLTLYEPLGRYQLKILKIEAAGEGILQKQLDELIKKLKGEGLFDEQHKKGIPLYPKKVCVVTSHGSDAWNDFKKHTIDKFPLIEFYTADVRVQGAKSIPQLLETLPRVDDMGFDVIVITRGGGSLEDLAAFNDEQVARAIYALKTPVIVAIGHEANQSLAEWVSDRRASTPTDAANVVTLGYNQVLERLESHRRSIFSKSSYFFSTNFQRLDINYRQLLHMKSYFKDLPHKLSQLAESLRYAEKYLISDSQAQLAQLEVGLGRDIKLIYLSKAQQLIRLEKSLTLLSPKNTLSRGYAIATDSSGKVIRSIKNVVVGQDIEVKLKDGNLQTTVNSKS